MAADSHRDEATTGAVVIGRNESDQLSRALDSVRSQVSNVVYVDSHSSDGSVALARTCGVTVVELDESKPCSAARARNAGFLALQRTQPALELVLFMDGDCELLDGFVHACTEQLRADPRVVAVRGIRRERYPERSIYNRICDVEWRSPSAWARHAIGGDVVLRASSLEEVGGYNEALIAGEDEELGIRLRRAGGRIARLSRVSTLHDAKMTRFRQWWTRAKRCGHAYAHVSSIHVDSPECCFAVDLRRIWIWGCIVPLLAISLALLVHVLMLLLLAVYIVRVGRIAWVTASRGFSIADSWAWALSCGFSKFPEFVGVLHYCARRRQIRGVRIIEYKSGSGGG